MKNSLMTLALTAALGISAGQSFAASPAFDAKAQTIVAFDDHGRTSRKDGGGDDKKRVIKEIAGTQLLANDDHGQRSRKDGRGDDRRRVIEEVAGTQLLANDDHGQGSRKDGRGDDKKRT